MSVSQCCMCVGIKIKHRVGRFFYMGNAVKKTLLVSVGIFFFFGKGSHKSRWEVKSACAVDSWTHIHTYPYTV